MLSFDHVGLKEVANNAQSNTYPDQEDVHGNKKNSYSKFRKTQSNMHMNDKKTKQNNVAGQ